MNSASKFIQELNLNIKANHPVSLIYTEDQFETLELIHEALPVIRPDTDKMLYWSSTTNWIDISEREKEVAEQLAIPNLLEMTPEMKKTVLKPIFASPETLSARKPVFIVSLISAKFKKDVIEIIQELRDFDFFARNGVNETYRLIVIANKSFEITSDYDNLFGIIEHLNPSKEEIQEIYQDDFLDAFVKETVAKVYTGDFDTLYNDLADLSLFVQNTMVGLASRQVKLALHKSLSKCASRDKKKIVSFDLEKFKNELYEEKFKELASTGVLTLLKPYPMEKVGGLNLLKDWIKERAYAMTPAARAKGIKKPKGALLVGLPGTGKSLVAKAMGDLLDRPIVQLELNSMFSSLVGSSEQRMKDTLKILETIDTAVLYIDEIDKVFSGGGGGDLDGGTTSRVLGKLLTWLQENESEIFVIMTANRIHSIPPELLRKGRFDELFYVALPNEQERKEILDIHLVGYENKVVADDVVLKTKDFSSVELEYIVNEGALKAAYRDEDFATKHILGIVSETVPMATAFREDMEAMATWARTNAKPASSVVKPSKKQGKSFVEDFNIEV